MVRVVRATQVELESAVQALRDGELVAFPTETVYGLGANAQNPAAVRKIRRRISLPPLRGEANAPPSSVCTGGGGGCRDLALTSPLD